MNRLSAASGLLVLCIAGSYGAAAAAQEASVYKWVDAQGVLHFSDEPPASGSAEELAIRYNKTNRAALQARLKAESKESAAADASETREAGAEAGAEADRQKVLAERAANCKAARDRVAKYTDARRLYKPGADGERVYLTSEEIDVERAEANRAVDEWCSGE